MLEQLNFDSNKKVLNEVGVFLCNANNLNNCILDTKKYSIYNNRNCEIR